MVREYRRAAHANNTHATYSTAGRRYSAFGEKFGIRALFPATDDLLCEFASYLAHTEHLTYGTIKGYLFGIRSIQLDMGMDFPAMRERYPVHQTLKGIRRKIGDCSKPKMPVTVPILKQFARTVRTKRADPAQRVRWGAIWAAVLVGFFGMLRKDNLTKGKQTAFNNQQGLTREDVRLHDATAGRRAVLWLRIRYSKTNQTQGEPLVIPVAATGDELCPVEAVRTHMAETKSGSSDNLFLTKGEGPRGGQLKPLTHAVLVSGIKELAKAAGMDPAAYAGHSLRRGGATMAFQMGVSSHLIKQQGNWKSDAVFLYHQLSVADRLRLPTLMAQKVAQKAAGASQARCELDGRSSTDGYVLEAGVSQRQLRFGGLASHF